jgi:hypothetical protein
MPLDNPIPYYLQAVQNQNQNRNQMNQDLASLGQGLGQGFNTIRQALQEQKKKQLLAQIVQAMKTQGSPQQGPQMSSTIPAGQPMSAGTGNVGQDVQMPPTSGMGGPSQDNTQLIQQLMMQYDPQSEIKSYMDKQDPYKQALTQQALSEADKNRRPPAEKAEWSAYPGTTKDGKALELNKLTGEIRPVAVGVGGVVPNAGSAMAGVRQKQFTLQDLPSNQGPTTAGGAAYQVKVAARQGMNLIAKAGSPQRTALATGDLARAILRNAPTDEAMRNANFSDTVIQKMSALKQKITADPTVVSNPQIRQEMYNIFQEMDKSATPFIQNQLDDMADAGFPVTDATRKRQMGETLPVIPFQEAMPMPGGQTQAGAQAYSDPGKEARYQAWKKSQGL